MASNLDFIHTLHELRMGIGLVEVNSLPNILNLVFAKRVI